MAARIRTLLHDAALRIDEAHFAQRLAQRRQAVLRLGVSPVGEHTEKLRAASALNMTSSSVGAADHDPLPGPIRQAAGRIGATA
jgi:hypothetical protein